MRYAIYATPPSDHPLTKAAARWLGRDAFTGRVLEQPALDQVPREELARLTEDARRYGFHGTLKAPFELAPGRSEAELVDAFEAFCASMPAFTLPEMVIGRLGPFFALVPSNWSADLQMLSDECVMRLDSFRAPLTEADYHRRKPEQLNESQRQNLRTWGYPYVFEEFRFHMTLTGPVPESRRTDMQTALSAQFADFIEQPLVIDHLGLFVEPARGEAFAVHTILKLAESTLRKTA
jgi:putative phosphonate metabolism protein